jgi:hypothetical protein
MKFVKKPASLTLLVSILIFVVTELIRLPNEGVIREFRRYYNGSFIEPLEIVAVTLLGVSIWLAFFTLTVQKKWWRIARWFIGIAALILTFSLLIPYQGGGFISFPGVRELIILWALVFGLFTVGLTLVSRKSSTKDTLPT